MEWIHTNNARASLKLFSNLKEYAATSFINGAPGENFSFKLAIKSVDLSDS
jgi:hypothetical protein